MHIDEMIAVLQAAKAGKILQLKDKNSKKWYMLRTSCGQYTDFDFSRFDYRVNPEPREWRAYVTQEGRLLPEDTHMRNNFGVGCIKVREVLE